MHFPMQLEVFVFVFVFSIVFVFVFVFVFTSMFVFVLLYVIQYDSMPLATMHFPMQLSGGKLQQYKCFQQINISHSSILMTDF